MSAPIRVPQRTAGLRRERHAPDYWILVAVVALSAIGILMVFSSSAMKAYVASADTFSIVGPQLIWALLGLIAMFVMMRVDYRVLRLVSVPLYALAILLLVAVLVPGLGISVGGSARWLRIGPLPAVHPAEFAKFALIVYLAHWFAARGSDAGSFRRGFLPFLLIFGPVVALVLREPDLGTSSVLGLTAFTMFFLAGANLGQLFLMGAGGLAVVSALVLQTGYQLTRVKTFLDPWSDARGEGFHTIQGLLALGLGGLIGTGLGESRAAGGLFLPNAFNDFIFAVVGEELGLVGACLVIGLFAILVWSGARTALAAPDTFGALLAAGITAWLTIQAFINIAVVVVLVPVTGITLPFISAGGSSLIISFAAVGVLLSISRETGPQGRWVDASADRGRRHGRAHLPGSRRRSVAPRATGRA
jgi:cell division protein FtsW